MYSQIRFVVPQAVVLQRRFQEGKEAKSSIHIAATIKLDVRGSKMLPWEGELDKLSTEL